MTRNTITALDLFAGTGWGVACHELGIEEFGVELMPEAIATRTAAGMATIYEDVWDGLLDPTVMHVVAQRLKSSIVASTFDDWLARGGTLRGFYDLLIASPPCQTFSMAGKGAGRQALVEVLAAIDDRLYENPAMLHSLTESLDPRTALVLTPLAHVYRDRPTYVVLEQVPTVQPVWEACAVVMREMGYSVVTGVLNSEQYGVPQTRRRAILIGRLDGVPAEMPAPTHSRYYSRDKTRLDSGVLPWVSMAEALGWTEPRWEQQALPATTIAGDPRIALRKHNSKESPQMQGAYVATIEEASELQTYPRGWGLTSRPAPTQTGHGFATRQASGHQAVYQEAIKAGEFTFRPPFTEETARLAHDPISLSRSFVGDAINMTAEEQAVIQSYSASFPFQGNKGKVFLQIGNAVPPLLARAVLSTILGSTKTLALDEQMGLAA